jgi:hypothetical protein
MCALLTDSMNCRSATRLDAGLDKSLSAYASVAAAAGVGVLALAAPAGARVVYTPAKINIPFNVGWTSIDLNHDGIADFSFAGSSVSDSGGVSGASHLDTRASGQGNAIWGRGGFAAALHSGFNVRPSKSYFQVGTSPQLMARRAHSDRSSGGSSTSGQWNFTHRRYLGLKFMIAGQVHYGWARVDADTDTVTGYAYETIPNKPIITGKTKGPDVVTLEPVSLGRLSQGASGIPAWRRRK